VEINKHFRIEADSLNILLLEKHEPQKGGPAYDSIEGYFANIGEALRYVVDAEIKGTGLKDIATINAKIKELHGMIDRIAVAKWSYSDVPLKNASSMSVRAGNEDNPPKDTSDSQTDTAMKTVIDNNRQAAICCDY
jgi:hypothetical protein